MRDGCREGNVPQALTTYSTLDHLNAALLTDHTTVLHALVLAAQALVVLHWPKDLGAEQTIALRLKSPIINGLRLFDLSMGPVPDLLWGSQADSNGHVVERILGLFVEVVDVLHD